MQESLNLDIVESDIAALSEDQVGTKSNPGWSSNFISSDKSSLPSKMSKVRASVDSAVGQLVNPLKMKGQLVNQLQTQITDLEMFIQFLQVFLHS